MASYLGIVVFVIAIVAAIVIGETLKKNSGIIALVFAFIIGCGFSGLRAKDVIAAFPIDVFYLIFISTFFYGFMHESGFVKGVSDRMLYACRNKPAVIPPMLLLITFVLAAMGAADASFLIIAPLAFGLAIEMGFNPILAVIAVQAGGSLGGYMPWSTVGALQIGLFEKLFESHSEAVASQMGFALTVVVAILLLFFGTYFATKGNKVSTPKIAVPEPFNKQQKKSFVLVSITLFCLIILPLLNAIFHNSFFGWLVRVLDIRTVMTIAALAAMFLKLSDERTVLTKRVPWGLMFLVCGMMTLINLATTVGTIEFITGQISEGLNPTAVVLVLFVAVCLLGAVTGGITVVSLLMAIILPLSAASGIPGYVLMACALCGIHGMSISPYSAGGAYALSGCPDEMRSSVVKKQYLIMFIQAALLLVLTLIGLPKFFAGWFV